MNISSIYQYRENGVSTVVLKFLNSKLNSMCNLCKKIPKTYALTIFLFFKNFNRENHNH